MVIHWPYWLVFVYACFSASSNLAYLGHGTGNTLGYLVKHFAHIWVLIIYGVHRVPYHYFRAISKWLLPVVWILLTYTLIKGTVIAGLMPADGFRCLLWDIVSNINIGVCSVILFVARYLSKSRETPITLKASLWELWLPISLR
jgi:cell division protein FtsW